MLFIKAQVTAEEYTKSSRAMNYANDVGEPGPLSS